MKIKFSGNCNDDKVYLNSIILVMRDDREITLDREWTEWSRNEKTGEISITFETPYVWDGEGMEYDGDSIISYIDNAKYFLCDIEDDAPFGYELLLKELYFIDRYGNGHELKHYEKAADYKEYTDNKDGFSIYQLKNDVDEWQYIAFESLSWIRKHGFDLKPSNYKKVYEGKLNALDTLESLYERFNIYRPEDFKGHSMSVSDIVVLRLDGKESAYYVDGIGFTSIPEFLNKEVA